MRESSEKESSNIDIDNITNPTLVSDNRHSNHSNDRSKFEIDDISRINDEAIDVSMEVLSKKEKEMNSNKTNNRRHIHDQSLEEINVKDDQNIPQCVPTPQNNFIQSNQNFHSEDKDLSNS